MDIITGRAPRLFWHPTSPAKIFCSDKPTNPHTRRVTCSTECPCLVLPCLVLPMDADSPMACLIHVFRRHPADVAGFLHAGRGGVLHVRHITDHRCHSQSSTTPRVSRAGTPAVQCRLFVHPHLPSPPPPRNHTLPLDHASRRYGRSGFPELACSMSSRLLASGGRNVAWTDSCSDWRNRTAAR